MSMQRRLSWNAARRHLYSDRKRLVPGVASARLLVQGLNQIRHTCLVTSTGAFDRAAIMRSAVEAAKAHQRRTGAAWSASMSVGLTAAWQAAKAARLSAAPGHASSEIAREMSRNVILRTVRREGEGRAANYGGASLPPPLTQSPLVPFIRGVSGLGTSLI